MTAKITNGNRKGARRFGFRPRVGDLTRSFIYQPLAVLLAILLLPSLSWFESGAGSASVSIGAPFQASAQIVTGGCNPFRPNAIIQVVCSDGPLYVNDLYQLESDAVTAYLGEHNLPASDANFIYDEGRVDLRSAIRASIFAQLLMIINKTASQRTQHEQNLYSWLQYLVQQNEIAEYTSAIQEYKTWQADPCGFKLDADIASQYGLSYDGALFCVPYNQFFGGQPVPAESYFLAYGMKNSYGAPAQAYPNFADLVARTQNSLDEALGIGLAAGAVLGTAVGVAVAALVPTAIAGVGGSVAAGSGAFSMFVSGQAAAALGAPVIAAGPAYIVFLALVIGVAAGFETFSNQQTIDQLNDLSNTLAQVTNNAPDLGAFAADTTGLGTIKLNETFVAQTLPGHPSKATLPAHRPGTDPSFAIAPWGGSTPVASEALNYQDWDGHSWSAQTYGGWFVQTCTSGASCLQADSMIATIDYVDWAGMKWTASRIGYNFVSTKLTPAGTDHVCPADETTGVTPGPDFSNCISYVSSSISLKDASGNPIIVSLTLDPAFSTSATLNFTTGQSSSSSITATGNPVPNISLSGSLPAGFSFSPGNGTAALNYTNAPEGTYQATVVASNGYGSVTQTLTINVITALSITSPSALYGTAGVPVNFLVTTTGDLPITLSMDPRLLQGTGMSFTDNGNGTGTIHGTAGSIAGASCVNFSSGYPVTMLPCGITATNGTGSVTQNFTLNFSTPPQAVLVGPANATFSAGNPNSVLLVSTGAITPVYWTFNFFGYAPSWVTFHDNGNGTGVLSGTPPIGTSGSYTFTLAPYAAGDLIALSYFTVNVKDIPGFLTPDIATFTAGTAGSFEIQTDGPAAGDSGATLPPGLTFQAGNPATITGTPAAGTGGTYTLLLSATDSRGTGSQLLALDIDESPTISSSNVANFRVGVNSSFDVTTLGYPSLSTSQNPTAEPTSPGQGLGMHFEVQGLPPGFTASNLNPEGFATGTLTITGTPTEDEAGAHQVLIKASNGVGTAATQLLYVSVLETAPAPSSSDTCDGVYLNGTFNGNINVHPGQSCTLSGGYVTGNIRQLGGTLTLKSETVGGDVNVGYNIAGDGFDIETSKIGGSLYIQNVLSGPAKDRVCGSNVTGFLQVENNPTAIQLGSNCPGNTVGEDLQVENNSAAVTIDQNTISDSVVIHNNTGSTQVFQNKIGAILQCTDNTTISGGQNIAAQKLGQCAAF